MSLYQKKYKCDPVIKEFEEIDITSLLDILVILLVFLLKSYNASSLQVNLVKDLNLVDSTSRDLGQFAPVIQVNAQKDLYLENKLVTNVTSGNFQRAINSALTRIREAEKERFKNVKDKKPGKSINIVLDQDLPYSTLDKIMNVATSHDYENFKFIVRGDYN